MEVTPHVTCDCEAHVMAESLFRTESLFRLLPWTSPDGRPCYLSTDDPESRMSRLADDVEAELVACGEDVLAGAREVLDDASAGEVAVRFALRRTTESLRDVLRVAECRSGTRPLASWAAGGVAGQDPMPEGARLPGWSGPVRPAKP